MAITKWNPIREIDEILDHYSKIISLPNITDIELLPRGDWAPRVDIAETDKSFMIKMDAPEIEKKDVKISVTQGTLSIKGERMKEKEEEGKKFHRIERYFGTFCRSFKLPKNVDIEHIEATFKDGLLTVEIPKLEEIEAPQIEVKIN